MDVLPLVVTSGWASGVNSYLVVLFLGVAGRLGLEGVPVVLTRTDVLVIAGLLYAMEFVADKIPLHRLVVGRGLHRDPADRRRDHRPDAGR